MSAKKSWFYKLSIAAVVFGLVAISSVLMSGQSAPAPRTGTPEDWSHHHLVFSHPGSFTDAVTNGTVENWNRIITEPRFQMQQIRRSPTQRELASAPDFAARTAILNRAGAEPEAISAARGGSKNVSVRKDWSMNMGGSASSLTATVASTINSGNVSSSSTFTFDAQPAFTASAPTSESQTLTVSSLPTSTSATVTVTNGANNFTLTENGAAATATGAFATPQTTTATLLTITTGPNTIHVTTSATAGSFPLTLDSGGTTNTGSITYTYTGGASAVTMQISPVASGGGTCSGSAGAFTGTFTESATSGTAATNFNTALGACLTASGLTSSFTHGAVGAVVTLTDVYLGNFLAVANGLNRTTGTITSGNPGTAACTLAGSTYTVDYVSSNSTSTMASNLLTEINACAAGADIHASGLSGSSLTISSTVLGTGSFATSAAAVFNYTSTNNGSAGSSACTSSTAGTFGTGADTAAVATSISAAINLCTAGIQAATGINAASTHTAGGGTGVTIFALTPGSTGGSGISLPAPGGGFATWGGGSLSGGSDGTNTGTTFAYWTGNTYADQSTLTSNIVAALKANATIAAGFTISANSPATGDILITDNSPGTGGNSITLTETAFGALTGGTMGGGSAAATIAADQYPAKYSFGNTVSCGDYVVYSTGLAGSSSQATVVAYNNIYSTTCSGGVPSIYWAYNTGGTSSLSPVISLNGDQIAYIQTSGSVASLVLLKMASSGGTPNAPVALTSETNADYRGCTAPCYTTITLSGSPNDTNSSPFYNYAYDTMYVGDNSGKLHEFTGVFAGTPAESGAPFASTGTTNILTSPVVDPVSTNIFVGDSGGYLYRVTTAGVVTASGHLAVTGSTGIVDAPLVDSTPATPVVYVFVGDELLSAASAVFQFSTGFAATSTGIKEVLNSGHSGGTTTILYDGDFDNIHYSGNGTTGNLYVCTSHNGGTEPQLFSIPMNAGFTLTPVQGPVLTSAAAACSPVTEVDGNVHDWIFLSVTASGNASGCTGACLYNYNVDSALAIGSVPAAGLAVTGGASGIIIDNTSTSTGASQIYFTPLGGGICTGNGATGAGTGGCAVQASQSGLN